MKCYFVKYCKFILKIGYVLFFLKVFFFKYFMDDRKECINKESFVIWFSIFLI